MVRSINIQKTDRLVWGMIKSTLELIRDRTPMPSEPNDLEHQHLDDRDGLLTDGITWMSPDQVDLLSDVEKKAVINKLVTRITASFDKTSNKHQIDVVFSETVARLIADPTAGQRSLADEHDPTGNTSVVLSGCGEDHSGESAVKKCGGSAINSAADHGYSVTVE